MIAANGLFGKPYSLHIFEIAAMIAANEEGDKLCRQTQ
jgi:hypothetical protein